MKSKGVTPVVATVLLMAIAVAATTTAYQFIINTQNEVQEATEAQLSQEELQRKSNLNIEAIYEGNNGNAFMTVRNTGSVRQTIQEENGQKLWYLYVDDRPVGGDGTDWSYVGSQSGRVVLSPDSTINIDTHTEFPQSGEEKKFELIGRYESSDTNFCENTGDGSC